MLSLFIQNDAVFDTDLFSVLEGRDQIVFVKYLRKLIFVLWMNN